jgi:hypothetical protein
MLYTMYFIEYAEVHVVSPGRHELVELINVLLFIFIYYVR